MSSVQGMRRSAGGRNKFRRKMFSKRTDDRVVNHELCLAYSAYLAQKGKIRESLNILCYAAKISSSHFSTDKISSVVRHVVHILRQNLKETCLNETRRNPLSCPLCLGVLHEPCTFPCGHTYCKSCAKKDLNFCVVCQAKLPVLEPSEFHVNVLISSVVEKWWDNEINGVLLRTKGAQHYADKEVCQAIDSYTEAIKFAPNDHVLLSNRSHAYLALGRADDGLKDANEVLLRNPEWTEGYYSRASALLSLGREEDALVALLICASLENAKDLDGVVNEISRVMILIMSRYNFRPSEALGKRSSTFSVSEEEVMTSMHAEEFEKRERKANAFKNRRRRLTCSPSTEFLTEEIPVVDRLLKKFEVEIDKFKNNTPIYLRAVDPQCVQKSDFECSLCYHYFWEPVTTPCGHTFCRMCLDRCLDHTIHCPLCKAPLRDYLAENRSNITEFVEVAMQFYLPKEYRERCLQHEHEMSEFAKAGKDLQHEIPIFVATLAIPSILCPLHVFEPRYRLLIRRVMEAGTREFGMCMPSNSEENGFSNYGTMLEVRDVKPLNDGRRIVNAVGSRRFRCISKGIRDGYNTARVEYLQDTAISTELLPELQQLHDLVYKKATDWFFSLDEPTKCRILSHYGPMPAVENTYWTLSDGPVWVWWLIAILPLEASIQLRIIKEYNLNSRLQLVSKILRCVLIHQSRSQ